MGPVGLVVQHPGLGFPTSDAQAWLLAKAARPCQPHGSEEAGEKKKKKEKITKRQNPKTNAKSKTKQTKLQKESYTHTHKKRGKQMEESNTINKETHKWKQPLNTKLR